MVELIVTIVVIGIAFATLPMILRVSNASLASVMEVDDYFHGFSKVQLVASKSWDEANLVDLAESGIYKVLVTQNSEDVGPLFCDRNKSRHGHATSMGERQCTPRFASNTLGVDSGDGSNFDDIDDFNGNVDNTLRNLTITTEVDYIRYQTVNESNTTDATVFNMQIGEVSTSSNIKRIRVRVTDDLADDRLITEFTYFATNIGSVSFK